MYTLFSQDLETFVSASQEVETLTEAMRLFNSVDKAISEYHIRYFVIIVLKDGKPIEAKWF